MAVFGRGVFNQTIKDGSLVYGKDEKTQELDVGQPNEYLQVDNNGKDLKWAPVNASSLSVKSFKTWAELSATTGTNEGDSARVFDDAGTHTDVETSLTVDNEGEYSWSVGNNGWRRVADLTSEAFADTVTQTTALVTQAETARDTAETHKDDAETAATSVSASVTQISTNSEDIKRTYLNGLFNRKNRSLENTVLALEARLRSLESENQRFLSNATNIVYADPTASGDNDGSSWADAYTDLKTAIEAVPAGGVLYTNSTEANPFTASDATSVPAQNIVWCSNKGSDKQTWISGAQSGVWTDEGGGIFSITPATTPVAVAYDLKRDDISGTVTGIDLTQEEYAKEIKKWNRTPEDLVAWYGSLSEASSPTATPAEGEWSFTGGDLYINPPGTPSLTDVNNNTIYGDGRAGVNFRPVGDVPHSMHHYGNLKVFYTPGSSDGEGYSIRHRYAQNVIWEDTVSIYSGYHSIGFTGESRDNNTIRNCTTIQAQAANPYVFYTDQVVSGSADITSFLAGSSKPYLNANHLAHDIVYIAVPHLKNDGSPLDTTFSPRLGYSHTPSHTSSAFSGIFLSGIEWTKCLQLDFSQQLEEKHSISMTVSPDFIFARDHYVPPDLEEAYNSGSILYAPRKNNFDQTKESTFGIKVKDSTAIGRGSWLMPNISHINCRLDRLGYGSASEVGFTMSTDSRDYAVRVIDGIFRSGKHNRGYTVITTGDEVYFEKTEIYLENDTNNSLFSISQDGTSARTTKNMVQLKNCIIDSKFEIAPLVGGVGSAYAAITTQKSILSLGGNAFGNNIKAIISNQNNSTRDISYYLTNFDDAGLDVNANDSVGLLNGTPVTTESLLSSTFAYYDSNDTSSMYQNTTGYLQSVIDSPVGSMLSKTNTLQQTMSDFLATQDNVASNGDFASDLSDWSDASTGTSDVTWDPSGAASFNEGSTTVGSPILSQAIPHQGWVQISWTTDGANNFSLLDGSDNVVIASTAGDTTRILYLPSASNTIKIQNDNNTIDASALLEDFTILPLKGVPAIAPANDQRPILKTGPYLDFDASDDQLEIPVVSSLGENCTIYYRSQASQHVYIESQTIGVGDYALPTTDWIKLAVFTRRLSAEEKTILESWGEI